MRGIDLVVRSDTDQLADLIARVSTGELTVDIAARVALADLPGVHAEADAGQLPGKVLVLAHPPWTRSPARGPRLIRADKVQRP